MTNCACGNHATTTRTIRKWDYEWDHANDRPKGPGQIVDVRLTLCAECAECHDENAMMGRHA